MYRAKGHPEIGYAFFDSRLDSAAVERSQRIAELREGVAREEFRLDYQAVVDLDRNEIIGYEALVRWEHPTVGELPPGEFIPLAEETGLIVGLGEWVLTEACTEATRLYQLHGRPLHMSVNVSARQLHHPDFFRHVSRALDSSALLPSLLTLELTESALLASDERVARTLQKIKDLGVVLALDDFGRATRHFRICASSPSTSSRSTAASPRTPARRTATSSSSKASSISATRSSSIS